MSFFKTTLISTMLFVIYCSCQKTNKAENKEPNLSIIEAKTFLSGKIIDEQKSLQLSYDILPKQSPLRTFARVNIVSKKLNWENSHYKRIENNDYLLIKAGTDLAIKNVLLSRYFLFLKEGGILQLKVLEVLNEKESALVREQDIFDAYLTRKTSDVNLNFKMFVYNSKYQYEKSFTVANSKVQPSRNKIVLKSEKNNLDSSSGRLGMNSGTQNCELWGMFHVEYDENYQIISSTLLYTFLVCYDGNPSQEYGDPNGTGTNDPCFESCNESFISLVNSSSTSNTTVSDLITDLGGFQKKRTLTWKILRNPFGWHLESKESGIVELTDVQNNVWVWKNLDHLGIDFIGTQPLGGTVTHNQGIGTPSFMAGAQNVLYGGMSVNYTVTYKPLCNNCPILTDLLLPETRSYTSSAIWPAKP